MLRCDICKTIVFTFSKLFENSLYIKHMHSKFVISVTDRFAKIHKKVSDKNLL
jgi:hypothetical protein